MTDLEEMDKLELQIGAMARRNPGSVAMAILGYLLERSLGDNKSMIDYFRLRAYRKIVETLENKGVLL